MSQMSLDAAGAGTTSSAPGAAATQSHRSLRQLVAMCILRGALMPTQVGNTAAAAPFHALLPDMVPQEQRGAASGIMGLALFLGQIGGAVVPTLIGFSSDGLKNGTQSLSTYDQRIAL